MKNIGMLLLIGCLACSVIFTNQALSGEFDQKTILTFDNSVEIPGMVLPPDTYVFRLLDRSSGSNMVQVLSRDEKTVFAVLRTVPAYRSNTPTAKTSITFQERTAGSPQAIKQWFFPGNSYGYEFIYPKTNQHLARTDY